MNRPKLSILLTSVVVSAACLPSAYRGWQIVQFSEAEAAQSAEKDRAANLQPWVSVEGLQYAARQASYFGEVRANDETDAAQKSAEVAEILAVTPMSSAHWLQLSGLRTIARDPSVWIIAALSMSNVTGANEGYLMPQRASFEISSWESLPSDIRPAAVKDLVQSWKSFTDPSKLQLRNTLTPKPAHVRQEIRKALSAGSLTAEDLTQLGL
jgi:hypothetical protein